VSRASATVGWASTAVLLAVGVSPSHAVFLAGRGNPRSECYVGMEIIERSPVTVARHGTRVIQESCGDACDFHLRMHVNSPRAGCKPARLRDVLVIGDTGDHILERPPLGDREAQVAPHETVIRVALKERRQALRRLTLIADTRARPRHDRDTLTLVCRRSARACCGDGIVAGGEQCDDGNAVEGDGCDSNCTRSGCGNGVLDPGETCDDGNLVDGDHCDSNCTPSTCGNGVADPQEDCDPPSNTPCNGCGTYCDATCRCVEKVPCACPFTDGVASDTRLLGFTLHDQGGTCGSLSDGTPLACNHLYFGGGSDSIHELPLPDGITASATATCSGTTLALTSADGPAGCTSPGCLFGPPIVLNASRPPLCLLTSVTAGASGTIDCSTWDVDLALPLQAGIYTTNAGFAGSPCPVCTGKTTGDCTSSGLTRLALMQLPDFTLHTSLAPRRADDGLFCGYCRAPQFGAFEGDPLVPGGSGAAVSCTGDASCTDPGYPVCQQRAVGAFGESGAREIREDGRTPAPLGDGAPHDATMAGVFCVPPAFAEAADANASLPGPGAVALTGTLQLGPAPQSSTCGP
jgi:cysteine-rich repeat protein